MATPYISAALAEAEQQKLTSDQVAALDYQGIADLAGVTVGVSGDSPDDFFYRNVRSRVKNAVIETELAATLVALESELKLKYGDDVKVELDPDGNFLVKGLA